MNFIAHLNSDGNSWKKVTCFQWIAGHVRQFFANATNEIQVFIVPRSHCLDCHWNKQVCLFEYCLLGYCWLPLCQLLDGPGPAVVDELDVVSTCDVAIVSDTVTSHVRHLPLDHGRSLTPSGRFPSLLVKPWLF